MADGGNLENVNWPGFAESLEEIGKEIEAVEATVNQLAGNQQLPAEVWKALSTLTSAFVGLYSVVKLHHRHVRQAEEEKQ